MRKHLIHQILPLAAALLLFVPIARAAKPNFVVIFSDDQTYRAVGYRNPAVKSPNMDKLANEGLRFDRAFVASPICAASRASIYTGMFPQQHGTVGLASPSFVKNIVEGKRYETLPSVLEKAGYHTALYGKSHLGPPTNFGFTEGREIHDPNDDETFVEAEKFLQRESKSGRPFLLWLTPHNPHVPYTAPQRFKDLYKETEIKLDPNWLETPPLQSFFNQGPAGGGISFRDSPLAIYPGAPAGQTCGPPRSEAAMKEVIKAYYADISCLDEQIGRLEEQLKAAGLYENTILIYLSDNGYHLGNHGLGNKITMHEESVRVPMFMHSPLLPVKGAKSDALVSSLDVYPTILDLAGLPPASHLMGKSLRPVMNTADATVRDYVVSECVGPPDNRLGTGHRMVRTDHFKYILTISDEEAFFDLRGDPYELKNLIADEALKPEIDRHRAMLKEWMGKVGEKRLKASEIPPFNGAGEERLPKAKKGKKKQAVGVQKTSLPKQPDIVFLLADDLGNADVGWHGSEIRTPNLDKLAASGAKLEDFYVMPVCTPTRCAFLTGRYPIRSGMQMNVLRPDSKYGLPLEERTVANALRDAGYTTAICGKWHVGHFDQAYWPNARGFDHWLGHLEGIDYFTHNSYTNRATPDWRRNGELIQQEGYATELEASEAVDLIKRQPADKPLFLYVPFTGVHGPLQAPTEASVEAYKGVFDGKKAVLAAAMTAVDEGCGRILAALDATGRRANALIVFASDNGGLPPGKNLPYRAFKSSLYEGGIRSPALVSWPGHIKPGTVVREPLHVVDLYPTFVKAAGGSLEQKLPLDGIDMLPTVAEEKPSPHEDLLLNAIPGPSGEGALRMGDWKLVINGSDGVSDTHDLETGERKKVDRAALKAGRERKVELFNLRDDPGETKDLAAQHPDKVKELQRRYNAYAKAAVKPLQLQIKGK